MYVKGCNFYEKNNPAAISNNSRRNRGTRLWCRGFTLLEMAMVLAIMLIMTAIAVPRYAASANRYRADLAARRIVADLTMAKTNARSTSSSRRIDFNLSNDTYVLTNIKAIDGSSSNYLVQLSKSPYTADIVSANFNSKTYLYFNGWGLPTDSGTVVINVGSEERTISVDSTTGQISITDD